MPRSERPAKYRKSPTDRGVPRGAVRRRVSGSIAFTARSDFLPASTSATSCPGLHPGGAGRRSAGHWATFGVSPLLSLHSSPQTGVGGECDDPGPTCSFRLLRWGQQTARSAAVRSGQLPDPGRLLRWGQQTARSAAVRSGQLPDPGRLLRWGQQTPRAAPDDHAATSNDHATNSARCARPGAVARVRERWRPAGTDTAGTDRLTPGRSCLMLPG